MTTLEYLQLTSYEKTCEKQNGWFGIFIYGNELNGINRFWINNFLYKERYIKNDKLNGEYKVWDNKGNLISYELCGNGEFIKNLKK